MLISPEVGCSSPATQRKVVVLPQPEGPSSTTISPAGTAKLTPSIAGPADRELLAQAGDVERRRHDFERFTTYGRNDHCRYPNVLSHSATHGPCSFTYWSKFGYQTLTTLGSKPSG